MAQVPILFAHSSARGVIAQTLLMGKGTHAPTAGVRVAAVAPARRDDLFDRCFAMGRPCQASTLCEDAGTRDGDGTITYEGLDDSKGQAFMYPIPFKIRNTFVDCSAPSPSLRDFFQERKMQSAPPCRVLMPGSGVSEVSAELLASTPTSIMSETEPDVKAQHDSSDDANECKSSHRYWDVSEATPRSPDSTGQLFFSGDLGLPHACAREEQDSLACPDSTFFVVGASQLPNLLASNRFAMPDVAHKTAPESSASFAVVPCSAGASMDVACIPSAAAQRTVLRLDDVLVEPSLG